ncbi:MAG: M14 family zinc carboxypeptidase [Gammaproteobacteria bacterium]|nr:M14 family zinc carboxypeptidase [Gammaproteobacteria bacterium]MDH3768239.1 M14 family zinc carboxypeptidase [Gammaproteobacteria bacterium]
MRFLTLVIAGLLVSQFASALCEFENGTISNPDDPLCRDTQLVYTENDDSGDNIALGYPPPIPVDTLTAVDGFRTYSSLFAQHQDLMLTRDTVGGSVVGQTQLDRDIWAYSIGDVDNLTNDGRPEGAVIINGGIHAREWQSPEVLTEIFEQLVERSDDAHIGQYLRDNLNVVLLPVINIDGFIQTQTFPTRATADERQPRDGRMRRKNLRNPSGGVVDNQLDTTDDSFFGVDLNRNSVHGYGLNGGSSANPISLIYRGTAHSSESEILALQAATGLGPADRLRLGIDVHSFSSVYFTPRTGNTRRDAITLGLATRMRAVTNFKYRYSPGPIGSTGIGSLDNYYAFEFQIPSYTLEIEPLNGGQDYGGTGASHSGFVLPDSEITRVRDEIAATLLLGFYRQSGPPHVTAVHITNLARDEVVYAAQWVADGVGRRLEVTTDRAIVPSDDHRIYIAFNKPMRWYDANGNLSNYAGQSSTAGQLELNEPDGLFGISLQLAPNPDWLDVPGGPPDGYLNYRGDAFTRDMPLSQMGLTVGEPKSVALQIELTDIAEMALDADPSTPVDWQNGHWTGYEDSMLAGGDTGGADCTFIVFLADDANATAPPKVAECQAGAPPPLPPPPPPPQPAGGGGGGSGLWLLPLMLLAARRR